MAKVSFYLNTYAFTPKYNGCLVPIQVIVSLGDRRTDKEKASDVPLKIDNPKANTGFKIIPQQWSDAKQNKNLPKQNEQNEMLRNELSILKKMIENKIKSQGLGNINKEWLMKIIRNFHDQPEPNDFNVLVNWIYEYIDKVQDWSKKTKISDSYKTKLRRFRDIFIEFEKSLNQKKPLKLQDVNKSLVTKFRAYLRDNQKYSANYISVLFGIFRAMMREAKEWVDDEKYKLEIVNLPDMSFQNEVLKFPWLDFDEIEKIRLLKFNPSQIPEGIKTDALLYSRDFLVLSCTIGQRFTDILQLNKDNLKTLNKEPVLEFQQQKTKEFITIKLLDKEFKQAHVILKKYKGSPPVKNLIQYNRHIKIIGKIAGLNQIFEGYKKDPKTNRMKFGKYKKWELMQSHIARRSWVTNYIQFKPIQAVMAISGHKSQKTVQDYAQQPAADISYSFGTR